MGTSPPIDPDADTASALIDRRRLVLHGRGLGGIATLPALLAGASLQPARAAAGGADAVLAWGCKPSAERAQAWAEARGLPVLRLEDGFLRSVGLGADEPPLSVLVDDLGVYYDASRPSRLEQRVLAGIDAAQTARADAMAAAWRAARVSKYNHARERDDAGFDDAVLVVDQTFGDASIAFGQAGPAQFSRMLRAALDEHPARRILLKVHPDVVAGRKRGHFDALSRDLTPAERARVDLLASDVHPPSLLARVAAVYTVTSQLGFEALLWGRPVRCFGMPFYAGWGLTQDDQPAPARRAPRPLAALVHAALIAGPRCMHPDTGALCPPEALLQWMALQRRLRERFAPDLVAVGFSPWKRPIARRFLAGSRVRFQSATAPVAPGSTLVLWGRQPLPPAAQALPPGGVIRMEDGFLRSVGLGAAFVQPVSWVQDRTGIYYDGSAPSALEALLQTTDFDTALRARAAALRERIVRQGVTKYNLAGRTWQPPARALARPMVLVVGQVESDASIRHGSPAIRSNLALLRAARAARPDAWLVYKPHPDVVARLRAQGEGEANAATACDEIVTDVPVAALLRQAEEVHVMTSLAGFEALLRGTPVVAWGCPFYAGWGLTRDHQPIPRRSRRLALDELVAGALILYPTYLGRRSRRFTTPEQVLDDLAELARQPVTWAASVGLWIGRLLAAWRGR